MINQAISIIINLIPNYLKENLSHVEDSCEYFTIPAFSINKIKNVSNFLMINKKRLSENIESAIRINLQKNIDFINKSELKNAIWHGYFIENKIRKYFIIDVDRKQFIIYEEPLDRSFGDKL